MSGVEVVGIVLGALPLIISGLEHYAEGAETIKRIWGASQVFKGLARRLGVEHTIFRNELSLMLRDCVDIEVENALLEDVSGHRWADPDVLRALSNRLQDTLGDYLEHVTSIARSLEKFKDRLYLGSDGKAPFDNAVSFQQAYKRFRFALKKSAYEDLIKEIRDDNSILRILTEQTKSLQLTRKSRRIPDFDKIRSSTTSIFESLQKGLYATCGLSHKASIYLTPNGVTESRPPALHGERTTEDTFRIVLHHGRTTPKGLAPTWCLEEAEVRLLDAIALNPDISTHTVAGAEQKVAAKRAVSFRQPSYHKHQPPAPCAVPEPMKEIQDLCRSIESSQALQCGICLGYLTGSANRMRHAIYWPKQRLLEQKAISLVSLETVLQQCSKRTCRLSNKDAYRLAVSLATGMLRLHDTPWLRQTWNKTDITIVTQNGKVLVEHPFISAALDQITPNVTEQRPKRPQTRNQTLLTLGIILIELCLKKPIAELQLPEDLNDDGTKDHMSDFNTADRLVRSGELSEALGEGWNRVVTRCIYCDFGGQPKTELTDLSFRKAVFNDVVAELEENCQMVFGYGIDRT